MGGSEGGLLKGGEGEEGRKNNWVLTRETEGDGEEYDKEKG